MRKSLILFVFVYVSMTVIAQAQSALTDSSSGQDAVKNTIDFYYKSIGENAHLYNGSEYISNNYQLTKNPLFESIFSMSGSIAYDGTLYKDVPLAYDIYHEEVIINRYEKNFRIKLVNEKIDSFSFFGHHFIRIVPDSADNPLLTIGFYDVMYNGHTTVLVKRRKKYEETVVSSGAITQYIQDDHYFIKKDNVYYEVHNKKTTLQVYKDKKKDLQKLLRKNKIKFKPAPEFGIVRTAEYYDQLKN